MFGSDDDFFAPSILFTVKSKKYKVIMEQGKKEGVSEESGRKERIPTEGLSGQ